MNFMLEKKILLFEYELHFCLKKKNFKVFLRKENDYEKILNVLENLNGI